MQKLLLAGRCMVCNWQPWLETTALGSTGVVVISVSCKCARKLPLAHVQMAVARSVARRLQRTSAFIESVERESRWPDALIPVIALK